MNVTAVAPRSNAPITAPEYASSKGPSSPDDSWLTFSAETHCGVSTCSTQNDFRLFGEAFHDEPVDAANENRRVIQFAAFRQHGLIVEHVGQIREGGIIGGAPETLDQGMVGIQLENRQG